MEGIRISVDGMSPKPSYLPRTRNIALLFEKAFRIVCRNARPLDEYEIKVKTQREIDRKTDVKT